MLEPLSALNVATAVVQFLDFGIEFAGVVREIYNSVDGLPQSSVEILEDTKRISDVSKKLETVRATDSDAWAPSEKALLPVAGKCHSFAQELLQITEELGKQKSNLKTWDAARRAWRSKRKKGVLENMTTRLDRLRSDLCIHMIDVLRDQNSSMQSSLQHLMSVSKDMKLDIEKQLKTTRQDLVDAMRSPQRVMIEVEDDLCAKMDTMRRCANEASKYQSILQSLQFQEMQMRYIQIPEAYATTYTWMLVDEQSLFREWLLHSSEVFWISGKAGSGKSTLVKFLADSDMTKTLLKEWTATQKRSAVASTPSKLAVASYYFWKSGYPIQKSLRGLYQSLVYEIFYQCPTLIPLVCKGRWQTLNDPNNKISQWTQGELTATIHALIDIETWPCWFCFFIDGLDEYAGTPNEQYTMIQDLNHLAKSKHLKLCVSSRPWNVFRSTYGQKTSQMITLQDHSRVDLDIYISGQLERDDRFRRLAETDERAAGFALEIRQRADGVFLWVFLVVRSILDGLTEEDDIEMLQTRLRALPPTLELYFEAMLRSVDPIYKKYTARALLVACNAFQPLPPSPYYWLTKEMSDPDFALKAPTMPHTIAEAHKQQIAVRTWINKWCRDLLEVEGSAYSKIDPLHHPYRVQFLHRTVRDYLVSEDVQSLFQKDAGQHFNPRLSLCRSYLATAKTLPIAWRLLKESPLIFLDIAGYFMFHAKQCEVVDGFTPFDLAQQIDRTGQLKQRSTNTKHWTSTCIRVTDFDNKMLYASTFLSYAIEFDLQLYVQRILETEGLKAYDKGNSELWRYAMEPSVEHAALTGDGRPGPRFEILTALIDGGLKVTDALLQALNEKSTSSEVAFLSAKVAAVRHRNMDLENLSLHSTSKEEADPEVYPASARKTETVRYTQ